MMGCRQAMRLAGIDRPLTAVSHARAPVNGLGMLVAAQQALDARLRDTVLQPYQERMLAELEKLDGEAAVCVAPRDPGKRPFGGHIKPAPAHVEGAQIGNKTAPRMRKSRAETAKVAESVTDTAQDTSVAPGEGQTVDVHPVEATAPLARGRVLVEHGRAAGKTAAQRQREWREKHRDQAKETDKARKRAARAKPSEA